jgi:hypothetical protein
VSYDVFGKVYQAQQQAQQAPGADPNGGSAGNGPDDGTVEPDFEVKDE